MSTLLAAIRAQEAWQKKPKPPKPKILPEKREQIKDSVIMSILHMQEMGMPGRLIAKETEMPLQTIYNVKQRYMMIDVKNGKKWYKFVGI
jgi:DNA invertase Pin-like site-specific DNA recombinase|tara:strand:+ start:416 stop:685 length:270 start_codon:yes stop_codon:yes gene_type:complete